MGERKSVSIILILTHQSSLVSQAGHRPLTSSIIGQSDDSIGGNDALQIPDFRALGKWLAVTIRHSASGCLCMPAAHVPLAGLGTRVNIEMGQAINQEPYFQADTSGLNRFSDSQGIFDAIDHGRVVRPAHRGGYQIEVALPGSTFRRRVVSPFSGVSTITELPKYMESVTGL